MNHGHTITDSGHVHGVSDNGHSHGVNDPGHTHNILLYDNTATLIHNSNTVNFWNTVGENTPQSTTGITSFLRGTEALRRFLAINRAVTGISIFSSGTGISIANNGTGISVNGMTGNTGTAGAATGADANRPRNIAMLVIIKI
jgi:hypothetical protein